MPRDLESLIDIERAAQRILRFSQSLQYTELLANDEIDFDIVWDVIQHELPQLLVNLEPLISSPENTESLPKNDRQS